MKKVKFNGREYTVPDYAKWITQDAYGCIRVFRNEPHADRTIWYSRGEISVPVDEPAMKKMMIP
jgi:hypothetical protein